MAATSVGISYPDKSAHVKERYFLHIGDRRIYLANDPLKTYSSMSTEKALENLIWNHPELPLLMDKAGATDIIIKRTIDLAFEEEERRIAEYRRKELNA